MVVERVDPDRERQLALELGAAADEHGMPPRGGALGELAEQPGLADPGLAADTTTQRGRGARSASSAASSAASSCRRPMNRLSAFSTVATPCATLNHPQCREQRASRTIATATDALTRVIAGAICLVLIDAAQLLILYPGRTNTLWAWTSSRRSLR